jgi:hypothetical protein
MLRTDRCFAAWNIVPDFSRKSKLSRFFEKKLGKKLSGFFEKKPRQKTLVGCAANSGAGSGTFTGCAANGGGGLTVV